jgi:4-hydroxy-4-methyl-2-oxoglutarate aldolase
VRNTDVVFADDDGCVFIDGTSEKLLETARTIWQRERAQADAIRSGQTLRNQLRFSDYLTERAVDPNYTFRQHLRKLGGAIEE